MNRPAVSVIIPASGEAHYLPSLLEALTWEEGVEVVVSIPEGDRETQRVAGLFGVGVVRGEKGRGTQLHAGAKAAKGEILVFCHADTRLPADWRKKVTRAVGEGAAGGAFRLGIASDRLSLKIIGFFANLRVLLTGLAYGDQGIFVRRDVYEKIGGFSPIPIMEDVDFVRRLAKAGKFVILRDKVLTSARRWEREGVFYCTARNALLITLYRIGVSPERLAAWYR